MPTRFFRMMLLAGAGVLGAQQVVAPTPEQAGSPRGENTGNYNVTQSFETGYRWAAVDGNGGQYRSTVNYHDGIRLLGSSLAVNSRDGHGHYFDQILLDTTGLGGDPYESAILRLRKNRLYEYDLTWRYNEYFNPGLTVSGGEHLRDTGRRLQDHDLTLLPESPVRFRAGYSRNTEAGPALSTAQEFDLNGAGLPVFTDVRRQWNEYRLGGDATFAGFHFTVLRRWDFYKDDPSFAPTAALSQFQRTEPVHGSSPAWLGSLFTKRKLWAMNARMTYISGSNNFALEESAAGTSQFGGPASRQVLVSGDAHRPALAGDLSISLFPTERLTIVNNTAIHSNRIDGTSSYADSLFGTGSTIYFRYLGVRTVVNSTDLNYGVTDWLGFYAGYHYSDRLVRTVEGVAIPGSTGANSYNLTNILQSGTAGVRVRPLKPLTIKVDGELGRANQSLTPISERSLHTINGRADYRTRTVQLFASYRQVYDVNAPLSFSLFSSHSRDYTAGGSWTPNASFSLDASYTKLHLDTASFLMFFAGMTRPQLQTGYVSPIYVSNIHAANLGARFGIGGRADLFVGYSITKDTGGGSPAAVFSDPLQSLLNSVQSYPLSYQSPLARLSIRITPKIRWNAGWQFYDYAEEFHLLGYAQNYHANTGYTSVSWSF